MTIPQSPGSAVITPWHVFQSLLRPELLNELQPSASQTAYTPWVVTWLLVYQRLHGNATLADAVAEFLYRFPSAARPDCKRLREQTLSANTGAYSQARSQLQTKVLSTAAEYLFEALIGAYPPSWQNRRVFIIDGTTLTLAATDELTKKFPPASNQHGRSHWPVLHLVVAHELTSGLAATPQSGSMYGPDAVSELELATRILGDVPAGSVLLADRNFGVFTFAYRAVEAGHDVVVRMTEVRFNAHVKKGQMVREGCWQLIWKPSPRERKVHKLPASAEVSGWLHEVVVREGLMVWLFATMDSGTTALAELYRERLNVETDIRDLKGMLELDRLRGQSVSMVEKELLAARVAYNLAIQVRRLAAQASKVEPRRLSFAGVWSLLRAFVGSLQPAQPEDQWSMRFEHLLRAAGQRRLPKRKPGRSYPRELIPRGRQFPERKRVKPDG